MCTRVREPSHTSHPWKRATQLRKDREVPGSAPREGGREGGEAPSQKTDKECPILGHTRERAKRGGQEGPDRLAGPAAAT